MARGRIKIGRVSILMLLLIAAYGVFAWVRPVPSPVFTSNLPLIEPTQSSSIKWPPGGQAAIGASGYGLITTFGPQQPIPVASTVKVLTALAVLNKKPLALNQQGPTLTLGANDRAAYNKYVSQDGSSVPVKIGEQISEYQALEALLLPSANNIAFSLAVWAFGSMDSFLAYANQYAQSIGLTQTHLADASGFSSKSTSTAKDLTILALKSLENPVLTQIVGKTSATIPMAGTVRNVNWLLGTDGIVGIKTGNTDEAGGCFIFSAYHIVSGKKINIVGAVAGAPNLERALAYGRALANSASNNFKLVTSVTAGQEIGRYAPAWGSSAGVRTSGAISLLAWGGTPIINQINQKGLSLPAARNQSVGTIESSSGSQAGSTELLLSQSITPPSFSWRFLHPLF